MAVCPFCAAIYLSGDPKLGGVGWGWFCREICREICFFLGWGWKFGNCQKMFVCFFLVSSVAFSGFDNFVGWFSFGWVFPVLLGAFHDAWSVFDLSLHICFYDGLTTRFFQSAT